VIQDIDNLNRQIEDKGQQIKWQHEDNEKLRQEIAETLKKIHSQDEKISQREKKISSLKKKTQELEKFKFVLDYKIKDLKREIIP